MPPHALCSSEWFFFRSMILKWFRPEAEWETIAAPPTLHRVYCHFLALLWLPEHRCWAGSFRQGSKRSSPSPESLPWCINMTLFNQSYLYLCMRHLIFKGSAVINRLKHLYFLLWADGKFPLNDYTDTLKFLNKVCWGLWFIKVEHFYSVSPFTSSFHFVCNLLSLLMLITCKILLLNSLNELPFISYSWLSTLYISFHLIFSTVLWGSHYPSLWGEEDRDSERLSNLPRDTKLVIGRARFKTRSGTFLVVLWLRICLGMQGTQVRSLAAKWKSHMPQGT